ncbi:MAG: class I SAM-dependent methyltransferase [Chitinophagaceae bacterium]|nr:class I SAM-dependent methyltransferase [Chitinophagaceae bacterium]
MKHLNNKEHWEKIYQHNQPAELSWTEEIPYISLVQIQKMLLPKNAAIIDVGCGTSYFVDHLLKNGYTNITALDISETAISKVKSRLGSQADNVNWIIGDINQFEPEGRYDFWHDRATFHFLTKDAEIEKYISVTCNAIEDHGFLSLGTFSTNGPSQCSGLVVKQYNEERLIKVFAPFFKKIWSNEHKHITPFNTVQKFILSLFMRLS